MKSPNDPSTTNSLPNVNALSREDLEKLLSSLYQNFGNVRSYIDLQLTGNSEPLLKKFKKIIKSRLIEDIEEGTDGLSAALAAVHEFSLLGASPRDQADIMLWFVESAVDCSGNFGDLYEEFYEEAENMFETTLGFMKRHRLLKEFQNRCRSVVDESADTGYGFHDSIGDTYFSYYAERKSMPKIKAKMKPTFKKAVPLKPKKMIKPAKAGSRNNKNG